MGKKSLLKSTSKKKNAKTKTDSEKEITPAGKKSDVTAVPKKAKVSKKQALAKAKPAETQKMEEKKEKPLSIKELVLKKFDTSPPDTLFTVNADDAARKSIMAPPFISGLDPAETERVRKLLFKKFDLSVPDLAPAVAEKAPKSKKKAPESLAVPVSIAALLKQKFDIVVPAALYVPPVATSNETIASPPFVSGLEPAETERVRKLLFKKFDLSVPDPAPVEAAPVAPVVEEKVEKPKEKTPEPAIEKAPEPPVVPVSIEALLKRKFDIVVPAVLYVPPVPTSDETIASPPFVSGLEPAETERVRKLLFKTFDLSVPDPAPVDTTPPAPLVAEEVPVAEEKAAELEPATATPEVAAVLSDEKALEVIAAEPEPEPESKAEAAAPAQEEASAPVVETPKPPQRPLPIGLDFPEPPTVPTMPLSHAELTADQPAPSEPKKNRCQCWAGLDPVIKKAIAAGCGLAAVFLLIGITSFSNMSKYYLKNKGGAVEVWQGRFAPLGTDRIAVLTDARMKKETKSALSRAEVAPLIVENFVSRAEALMVSKGTPNFKAIRKLLKKALSFADDKSVRESILQRMDRIDLTALLFKATISAEKDSRSELEAAREYLTEAVWLARDAGEKQMIQEKLKAVNDRIDAIQPVQKVPPAPAKPAHAKPAAEHATH